MASNLYRQAETVAGTMMKLVNPQKDQVLWQYGQCLQNIARGLQADITQLEQKLGGLEAEIKRLKGG